MKRVFVAALCLLVAALTPAIAQQPSWLGRSRSMKARLSVVAAILLIGAVVSPALAQQDMSRPPAKVPSDIGAVPGHIPLAHYVPSRAPLMTTPLWVDASLIVNTDGTVNTTLLYPPVVKEVESIRAQPLEGGCVPYGIFYEDLVDPPYRTNLEEALQTSRLALLGKVTEKRYGFKGRVPGQLLQVEPEEILKGEPREVQSYFVFVPVGTFSIGHLKICKTDSRYPTPPAVGDQVVLFAPTTSEWQLDQREPLLELEEDGIVVLGADGHIGLPARYRQTAPSKMTPASLLSRLRTAAAASGAR